MKSALTNPVLDFINTLCNFIALNLIFLITCLPVITIGPALASLYYVTLREARGEYGYLVRTYLKEFKGNLKTGISVFAVLGAAAAVLLYGLAFWFSVGTLLSSVITGLLVIAAIAWLLTFTYAFPLIARFENSARQTIKNAFCIAMCDIKGTLFLLLIDALVFFFCLFLSPMKLMMVLFGFAFIAYCQSFVLIKVFAPYENE